MDVPSTDAEVVPEKIEDKKDEGRSYHCNLFDIEIVHKIAQMFLPGLASACVDNTTGVLFKTPGSVAVDIRTEMIECLTKRSEAFVAESVILENPEAEVSDHPYDILSDFVDDFAVTKRNLFSRVSGWLLSDKREDRIDDFVQEMETSGFWLIDRREAIAQTLLKNVDFKNEFHCDMKFNSENELSEHIVKCGFRSMICTNEGCNARFSVTHSEKHNSVCLFKIIPCEQKCPETLMRREMDRHCITVCPMKLANCPFYAVGCQSTVPQCMVHQHCWDDLRSHLLYILQNNHKDTSLKVLKRRVEQLEVSSFNKLVEAPDVRSLTSAIKDLEEKLGPLEDITVSEDSEEENDAEEKKLDEGKVNEEVENNEERKINEGGKVNENVENYKEREVNKERKASENGKVNEEGKSNEQGKVDGGWKMNREVKFNKEGKTDDEAKINGGKVGEETKINDEGKVSEEGKANEEGKISDQEEADDAGKTSDKEEADDAGKTSDKEEADGSGKTSDEEEADEAGKTSDEDEADEAGKRSYQQEFDDAGKTSDQEEADGSGKTSDQEAADDAGKTSDQGEADEAGKTSDQEEAEEAAKTSDQEEAEGARKLNDQEDSDGSGKLSDQEDANGSGKTSDQEEADGSGKTSDQEEANEAGKSSDQEDANADETEKRSDQEEADEAGKTSDEEEADEEGKTSDQEEADEAGKTSDEQEANDAGKTSDLEETDEN